MIKPADIPNLITAAELKALADSGEESVGPSATLPRSVSPEQADFLLAKDPLTEQVAGLLAPNGACLTPPAPGRTEVRVTSSASDLERSILGELADASVRRAVEDLAGRIRRAIDAGATDASRYEEGRIPQVDDEVIYRDSPCRVLRVRDPGPKGRLDLINFRGGEPEVFAAVQADLVAGWSWLGEPDPPEPTSEDRIRAALASGKPVPAVGSTVRLIRFKAPSYRGVEKVALRARVLAQVDVVGALITLDLEVLDPPMDGLDLAAATGVLWSVVGPVGPDDRHEGWSISAQGGTFEKPDDRKFHGMPCQRCGEKMGHDQAVQFMSRTRHDYSHPTIFAQLCTTCADQFGRLAFIKPPGPAEILDEPTGESPSAHHRTQP